MEKLLIRARHKLRMVCWKWGMLWYGKGTGNEESLVIVVGCKRIWLCQKMPHSLGDDNEVTASGFWYIHELNVSD